MMKPECMVVLYKIPRGVQSDNQLLVKLVFLSSFLNYIMPIRSGQYALVTKLPYRFYWIRMEFDSHRGLK